MSPTPEQVRAFVIAELGAQLEAAGVAPERLEEDFDLVGSGLLDSLGMMEVIMAVNDRFDLDVDFEGLDPEEITVLGPFSRYVAAAAAGSAARTP